MKTFDEAVEVVKQFLDERNREEINTKVVDLWHNNYCRCVEIRDNEEIRKYIISRTKAVTMPVFELITVEDFFLEIKYMLEIGIAIGQEMEKKRDGIT
jgi:hypothetical protein